MSFFNYLNRPEYTGSSSLIKQSNYKHKRENSLTSEFTHGNPGNISELRQSQDLSATELKAGSIEKESYRDELIQKV